MTYSDICGPRLKGAPGGPRSAFQRSANIRIRLSLGLALTAGLWLVTPTRAQETQSLDGLRIARVELKGLQTVSEAYVRRLLKTREGEPFARQQTEDDVRDLLRTRKFLAAFANTRVEEGQVVVTFTVQEKPTITSVEIVGAKKLKEKELYELTPTAGAVLDQYEVNRAREDILQKYKQKGYFYATVEVDEAALQAENRVIYRIVEGPRVKVRHIRYEGNRAYNARRLGAKVQTKTYIWILRAGALDEEQADRGRAGRADPVPRRGVPRRARRLSARVRSGQPRRCGRRVRGRRGHALQGRRGRHPGQRGARRRGDPQYAEPHARENSPATKY